MTGASTRLTAAVEAYFAELGRIRASGGATGERSSYAPLANLLDAVGATLKPKVFCVGELADQGAGHPDFGLYTAKQVQRGRPREGQVPERGVVEVKASGGGASSGGGAASGDGASSGRDTWLTAAGEQVSRYWNRYRLVLVTNTRDFVLVGEDAAGRAAKLETFRLTESEDDFYRKLEKPRAFAREVGAGLGEYLCRALSHRAALAEPKDVAWLLASYARDGLARVEAAGDAPSLEAVRKALEEALGVRFEGEKGARFFRSTLVQTLFYGVFSAWVLWARASSPNVPPGNGASDDAGVRGRNARPAWSFPRKRESMFPGSGASDDASFRPALLGGGPSAPDLRSVAGGTPALPGGGARFDWRTAVWHLRVPVLAALFQQLAAPGRLQPLGLVEVLDWTAAALDRVDQPAFFARFNAGENAGQDSAVPYFYEPFLEAFDPALRKQLGVWYTPVEVVRYMVARVDRALKDDLGIADGLAAENVYVLDPCCGTGAYLAEVLRRIAANLEGRGLGALAGARVKQAATGRVFGFELMPAPFVVAHLQVGLTMQDLDAPLADDETERAGIFLTNALTGWEPRATKPLPFPELEEERDRAERVKQATPILVILGNPPYNGFAGMAVDEERALSEAYRTTRRVRRPEGQGLNDLYVRFFRMAERRITEKTGQGIVCFISNYSWLDGLSFTGMRERYLEAFDAIRIDCLNGDKYKTGKVAPDGSPDPSIFSTEGDPVGIQVGTAIATLVRKADHAPAGTIGFRHLWGRAKREELLGTAEAEPGALYADVPPLLPLGLPFVRTEVSEGWFDWPALPELFPVSFPGVKTSRDGFLVDTDLDRLKARIADYFDPALSHEEIARRHPAAMQATARFDARTVREALLARGGPKEDGFVRFAYRPFDDRWLYWEADTKLLDEKRADYRPHVFEGNMWLVTQQKPRREWSPPQAISHIGCIDLMDRSATCIPTWLRDDGIGSDDSRPAIRPNLSASVQRYLERLGLSAGDLFHHILAVLHDPAYREANAGALRMEWPRIPLPGWPAPGSAGVSPAGVVGQAEWAETDETPALPGGGPSVRCGPAFRPRTPALPGGTPAHEGHEPAVEPVFPGNGASDDADIPPADGPDPDARESRIAPSGQVGRREAAEALAQSAARGRELARLLDSDTPIPGVTSGALRPEIAAVAVPATTDGRNMTGDDFALSPGWGHYGAGGAVMPGQGRIVERAFTPDERAALDDVLPALGETTFDVYLNARAFWRNVPAAVWRYKLGGYQVLKKWLSYRERGILDRPLMPAEVQHFNDTARRIVAILLVYRTGSDGSRTRDDGRNPPMSTLKKGAVVRHEKFGLGVVTEDEHEGMVSADFDGQVKRLSLQYAPLVRISSEDERERRESTFHQETDEDHEGHVHGSHWEPFYAEPHELFGNVQAVVDAEIVDAFSADYLSSHESLAAGIAWPEKAFYFSWPSRTFGLRMIAQANERSELEVASLFPHIGCGIRYPVTLKRVIVWSGGLEAQIDAVVGDALITFFDCRYGEHRNWYQEGAKFDFVLSALAYECGPADEETIPVTIRPDVWESMSGEGEPPKEMRLKGASMLMPVEEWDYDAFRFHAPVREVEEVEMLGQEAWLVTATVARPFDTPEGSGNPATGSDEEFDLPILVTGRAWRHDSPPEEGQDISGILWMQGFMQR